MKREFWSTKLGFILAATGSAVGLGSVWKFPYLTGENGGGAFVLVYLVIVALIGIPLIMAEFAIGRASGKNAWGAFRDLSPKRSPWRWIGGLAIVTSFLILSYYTVVSGWVVGYIFEALRFSFGTFASPQEAGAHFARLAANPGWTLPLHGLFTVLCAFVIARGIGKGIETWCKILMPMMGLILLILVLWGLTLPGAWKGLVYLFRPNFHELTWHAVLVALGQAFFTLSIGMGIMITYGSYLKKEEDMVVTSVWIVFFDTLVSLWSGIAVFSPVFTMGLDPAGGPGLVFHVLPVVFQKMPGGYIFGILFFFLLAITALASAISLLEVPVAYLVEEKGWKRTRATWTTASLSFLIGIPCALSFGPMSDITVFWGRNFFDFLDFLTSNIFLSVIAFSTAFLVGFVWGLRPAIEEISRGTRRTGVLPYWGFLVKFICPVAIAIILAGKLME